MANCTAGCITNFLCGSSPKLPVDSSILTPYVILKIQGTVNITVGNESNVDYDNTAIIKSFQFGTSNGAGTILEIMDEEGGNFERAMDKLNRCIISSSRDYSMEIEFGWIKADCMVPGGIRIRSKPFYFIPLLIEGSYSEGKIKFQIHGSSLLEPIFESRQNKTFPKMPLKRAIEQMMGECEPKIKSVKYLRRVGDREQPWDFSGSGAWGPDGPESTWNCNNQNKLAAAIDWMKPYLTNKNKAVVPTWNPEVKGGEVIFWEDPIPDPESESLDCSRSIGTYIVNGGSCLEGNSAIKTPLGWKKISQIVKQKYKGLVLSVDPESGTLVWSNVISWHKNLRNKRKLYKVKTGNNKNSAVFTEDHLLLTKRGYVRVDEITNLDQVNTGESGPLGNNEEAFIGIFLDKGNAKKQEAKFSITCRKEEILYFNHINDLINGTIKITACGSYQLKSLKSCYWEDFRKTHYNKDGKKHITEESIKNFSIVSLAYLYAGKGKIYKNNCAKIIMSKFSKEEGAILANKIKSLGIDCSINIKSKTTKICFDRENTKKLSQKISYYLHPIFSEKLIKEDVINCGKELIKRNHCCIYKPVKIIPWKKNYLSKSVYCIGVEGTNNFATRSGIAHNCSPVISFTPSAKWAYGALHANSGGTGGPFNSKTHPNKPMPGMEDATDGCSGTQVTLPFDTSTRDTWSPSLAHSKLQEAASKYDKANRRMDSIEAELRIQGDPEIAGIQKMYGRTVSLVIINPFHLNGRNCGDWLARPGCHPVYSNKSWEVIGIDHSIKEGSYVTTLKIVLAAPGSDIGPNEPFGGQGGWLPPTPCGA